VYSDLFKTTGQCIHPHIALVKPTAAYTVARLSLFCWIFWPLNSPESRPIIPLTYQICVTMQVQERVYQTDIHSIDIDELKQQLV